MADSGGGVAVGADDRMLRVACSVVYLFTCVLVYLLVEGGEVFDEEDGVSADGLKGGCLRGRKSNGGGEATQVEDFTVDGGELPVACEMDIVWVGDKVEFAQDFFGRNSFPFGIAEAGKADELVFDGFEALAVVEDAHAENAVGSLRCQGGQGL